MAVSVDTVYQRVLSISNKEQRGYITPQEFNLFANQAQMDIFEQYFYDVNQISRNPGNQTEYSDHLSILGEKVNLFEMIGDCKRLTDGSTPYPAFKLPDVDNLYRLGTVKFRPINDNKITDPYVNQVSGNNVLTNNTSSLTTFTNAGVYGTGGVYTPDASVAVSGSSNEFITFTNSTAGNRAAVSIDTTNNLKSSVTYRVSFTVSGYTSGKIVATLESYHASNESRFVVSEAINENGTYVYNMEFNEITNDGTSLADTGGALWFHAIDDVDSTNLSISEISIKQLATNWNGNYGVMYVGGNLKPSTTPITNTWMHDNFGLHLGTPTSLRQNRLNGTSAWGDVKASGHFYFTDTTFKEGNTYQVAFKVKGATKGQLILFAHLAFSFENHFSMASVTDSNYTSTSLYNFDDHGSDHEVLIYWTQGSESSALSQLRLYKDGSFDGAIDSVSVRLINDHDASVEIEPVNENELTYMLQTKLAKPTTKRPVYARRDNLLNIHPYTIVDGVSCNYIRKPNKVEWGYTEINGTALYNSSASSDFELHESEEVNLVIKILKLAGISIDDPQLYQVAAREDMFNIQQEKA